MNNYKLFVFMFFLVFYSKNCLAQTIPDGFTNLAADSEEFKDQWELDNKIEISELKTELIAAAKLQSACQTDKECVIDPFDVKCPSDFIIYSIVSNAKNEIVSELHAQYLPYDYILLASRMYNFRLRIKKQESTTSCLNKNITYACVKGMCVSN